jgi:hypothetical protein
MRTPNSRTNPPSLTVPMPPDLKTLIKEVAKASNPGRGGNQASDWVRAVVLKELRRLGHEYTWPTYDWRAERPPPADSERHSAISSAA